MSEHWHWFRNKSGITKNRPAWAGPVVIDFENAGIHSRPYRVRGIVVTGTTAGRLSPPEPSNGMKVSFSTSAKLPGVYEFDQTTGENWHNDGSPVHDKGHIMAIEIGGPDVAENIVPQLSNCQEHGTWRQMEREIKKIADASKSGEIYFFTAILFYNRELTETFSVPHRVLTPSLYRVTIHQLNLRDLPSPMDEAAVNGLNLANAPEQVMFEGELDFNERDDLESARLAMDDLVRSNMEQGKSRGDAEKEVADLFPDIDAKYTTTAKTKIRTNKSRFKKAHKVPPVSFKKHKMTPSQNKVTLEAVVKGYLKTTTPLTNAQIKHRLQVMERRGLLKPVKLPTNTMDEDT